MAYKQYTTHPAPDTTKRIIPTPRQGGETPAQRKVRLMAQAAANRLRVRELGDGVYQVPSQRKGPVGRPLTVYHVREFVGLGWSCSCPWLSDPTPGIPGKGLYVEHENDIALCAHVAQVIKHNERVAAEVARLARRMVARLEAQAESVPYVPDCGPLAANHYRALANAGLEEVA